MSVILIVCIVSMGFSIHSTSPANRSIVQQNFATSLNRYVDKDTAASAFIDLDNYKLVMQEDFNGELLDTSRWDYFGENNTRGFGKMLRSNIIVSDGTLKILSKRSVDATGNPVFSAGMISTQHSLNQKYGYFETRAKVNKQLGPHAAFWLLSHVTGQEQDVPNPSIYGTEIDIFEYHRLEGTENLYFGLHWNGYNFSNASHRAVFSKSNIPGISTGFHTFGLEWTPKEYIVYVDGKEMARSSEALSHIPEFVILSTEINGYGGDRFKMSSAVPDSFEVDYVKVYARKPSVTVYGKCDYYGWVSSALKPGSYTSAQLLKLGMTNDDASSIEVPKGWKVTAYEDDYFKGNSISIRSDARCANGFDNKMSSLKIVGH